MTEECFTRVEALLGTKAACIATGRPRATHYRRVGRVTPNAPRPVPPNKLAKERVELVLSTLNSPRFVDCSPAQAYHVLLDEGTYIASISTFYRVLRANGQLRDRRRQAVRRPQVAAGGQTGRGTGI